MTELEWESRSAASWAQPVPTPPGATAMLGQGWRCLASSVGSWPWPDAPVLDLQLGCSVTQSGPCAGRSRPASSQHEKQTCRQGSAAGLGPKATTTSSCVAVSDLHPVNSVLGGGEGAHRYLVLRAQHPATPKTRTLLSAAAHDPGNRTGALTSGSPGGTLLTACLLLKPLLSVPHNEESSRMQPH